MQNYSRDVIKFKGIYKVYAWTYSNFIYAKTNFIFRLANLFREKNGSVSRIFFNTNSS